MFGYILVTYAGKMNQAADALDLKSSNNLLNLFCKLEWANINSFFTDSIESNCVISSELITG